MLRKGGLAAVKRGVLVEKLFRLSLNNRRGDEYVYYDL